MDGTGVCVSSSHEAAEERRVEREGLEGLDDLPGCVEDGVEFTHATAAAAAAGGVRAGEGAEEPAGPAEGGGGEGEAGGVE